MIVRKRFRFLPLVVGSYRFCNRRQASKGFFRDFGDNVDCFMSRERHPSSMHLL